MHITPFENHDANEIADLITTIQIKEFGVATSVEKQPDLFDIPGFYQQGAGNFWLAFEGEELVGTIALLDVGEGVGALRKMFVKKEFRGREYGIGSALMQILVDWAIGHQFGDIYLGTVDVYHAAHRFYEKNGFREITHEELPERVPTMSVDVKYYHLAL